MYDKNTVLIDRREMLRVKAKSLAEEAHLIRREERRTRGLLRDELRWHRTGVVRFEARATHLACSEPRFPGHPCTINDRLPRVAQLTASAQNKDNHDA